MTHGGRTEPQKLQTYSNDATHLPKLKGIGLLSGAAVGHITSGMALRNLLEGLVATARSVRIG